MSQQAGVLDITFIAGEDLSSNQYYAVYLSADQTVSLCTTAHVDAIGILQNAPKSGEAATVRVLGTTKVVSGETTIAVGKRVYVGTDGKVLEENAAAQTEVRLIGIMLEANDTSGDINEMLITHFSFVKGAT